MENSFRASSATPHWFLACIKEYFYQLMFWRNVCDTHLYLLLQVVPDAHAQLVELVVLLGQTHGGVFSIPGR